jgi:hypothetical protein
VLPRVTYLKTGDWEVHINGSQATLRIRRIDEIGRVIGTLRDEPIVGWWSERAHRLSFVLSRDGEDAADDLAFEGYAWDEPRPAGVQRVYHLAGSYETFGGGGGAKDRQTFGWFATLAKSRRIASGQT